MSGFRQLRILYVGYPLLPVTEHSAGGAEQVLWTLEREVHNRGHQTTLAACAGSQVAGELFATGDPAQGLDAFQKRSVEQNTRILDWLRSGALERFDLIHDMSGGFWPHASDVPIPVLATLHLPPRLYKEIDFSSVPDTVSFNCVSHSQRQLFAQLPRVLGVVQNGIAIDRFLVSDVPLADREYLLWVGRICEEKGTHVALDVAFEAGAKLIIAGAVYPFLYHQKYYAREVIPRMKRAGSSVRFVPEPGFLEKGELIRNARALLVTSEIEETSSIVAMEAAACGTPVIAFRRGALPEVIGDGISGVLVDDQQSMVDAIPSIETLQPSVCRRYGEEHYSAREMAEGYEALYAELVERP